MYLSKMDWGGAKKLKTIGMMVILSRRCFAFAQFYTGLDQIMKDYKCFTQKCKTKD